MSGRTSPVQPVPVRAWAEYDEWQRLIECDEARLIWKHQYVWPKTGDGKPRGPLWIGSLSGALREGGTGPLRSIRVLLSTGHEMRMDHEDSEGDHIPHLWFWWLFKPNAIYTTVGGTIPVTTDTEAVEKALAAAIAWVEGQA